MKKGFGDLFGESWKEYFSKFVPILKVFLLLELLPIVVFTILFLILIIATSGFPYLSGMAISDFSTFGLTNFSILRLLKSISIPSIIISILLVFGLLILSYLKILAFFHISFSKNKNISFRTAFKGGATYFWQFVGLSLLLFFALSGLSLLLIIPGVIFMIYWVFSPYVLINENAEIIDSMKQSKKIVKGRWWRVFGFYLLIILILAGISSVLGIIPLLGGILANLFIIPFMIIYFKNFYLDLKKDSTRKK